jgi:ferredoxin
MTMKIDPELKYELMKYGARDFNECFNCGNCTAVCNLTGKSAVFPRLLIRDGVLGLKKNILTSTELWMCYGCGDCSESCPRQANPGGYMSALRRYVIAQYDVTGLSKLMFSKNWFMILFTAILSVILGIFLFTIKPDYIVSRWIFNLIPYEVIHNLGIIIFILMGLNLVAGITNMIIHLNEPFKKQDQPKAKPLDQSLKLLFSELGMMSRHKLCDSEEDSLWNEKPFYRKPWFIHYCIMYGFIGLLLATVLDFLFKDPASGVWWPSRILGTVTGLVMMYGSSVSIYYRMKKISNYYADTSLIDWIFIIFIWIAGLTGFWLEISVTFNLVNFINQIVFLVHTVISMELLLLFTVSKFAHAVYRPLALFYYFRQGRE